MASLAYPAAGSEGIPNPPAASAYEAHVRNVLTAEAVRRGRKPDLKLIVKLAKEIARTAPAGVNRT